MRDTDETVAERTQLGLVSLEGVFMETHSDTTKAASLVAGNLTTAIYVRLMIAAFRGETDVDATMAGTEVASTYSKILKALTSEQESP